MKITGKVKIDQVVDEFTIRRIITKISNAGLLVERATGEIHIDFPDTFDLKVLSQDPFFFSALPYTFKKLTLRFNNDVIEYTFILTLKKFTFYLIVINIIVGCLVSREDIKNVLIFMTFSNFAYSFLFCLFVEHYRTKIIFNLIE